MKTKPKKPTRGTLALKDIFDRGLSPGDQDPRLRGAFREIRRREKAVTVRDAERRLKIARGFNRNTSPMPPLKLSLLIHYSYTTYNEFLGVRCNAQQQFLGELVAQGLLKVEGDSWHGTPRGRAHVEALCRMPLPVCKWVTPQPQSQNLK